MKKNELLSLLVIFLFGLTSGVAQDAKAKGILDNLKKKTEGYTSMKADFDYTMQNKSEDIDETQSGSIMLKDKMYNLNIAGQKIICDGKTVWTVLEEAEEVQINNVPEDGESEDYISPEKILTLWENGFKYKYDKEATLNGATVDVVNLYPNENDDKSFHTIKLFVNRAKTQIDKIVIKGKDGTDYIYTIKNMATNKEISNSEFTFSTTKNPDFDVIDLR